MGLSSMDKKMLIVCIVVFIVAYILAGMQSESDEPIEQDEQQGELLEHIERH